MLLQADWVDVVKTEGPLGAVLVLVLAYFMKVLIPSFQSFMEKAIESFRADMTAARKDHLDSLKEERATHSAAADKLAQAIKEATAGCPARCDRAAKAVLLCFMLILGGCAFPTEKYIEADRATYEAVAPEYVEYVKSDAKLDEKAKARRLLTVASWGARITEAEKPKE